MQNPQTVDLLVSLAFICAGEGVMDEPLPIGMGLRVPLPEVATTLTQSPSYTGYYLNQQPPDPEIPKDLQPGSDGLVDFDELTREQVLLNILTLMACTHIGACR